MCHLIFGVSPDFAPDFVSPDFGGLAVEQRGLADIRRAGPAFGFSLSAAEPEHGAVEGLCHGAHPRGGIGGLAAAHADGPSFGFGGFCGEDINAFGA